MTTDAETNQQTEYTNIAELSRAIGRLEGVVEALVEGQRQLRQDFNEGYGKPTDVSTGCNTL